MDLREAFDAVMADLEFSMFIVTARAGDEPLGCLVGFATQASIDPSRFLICLSHVNHTYRRGRDATHFGVHSVPEGADELADLFGGTTGDKVDKFARVAWHEGPYGVPLLDGCRNRFVGRVLDRMDGGDHTAYLLEPVAVEHEGSEREFTFHRAKRIKPGHPA